MKPLRDCAVGGLPCSRNDKKVLFLHAMISLYMAEVSNAKEVFRMQKKEHHHAKLFLCIKKKESALAFLIKSIKS